MQIKLSTARKFEFIYGFFTFLNFFSTLTMSFFQTVFSAATITFYFISPVKIPFFLFSYFYPLFKIINDFLEGLVILFVFWEILRFLIHIHILSLFHPLHFLNQSFDEVGLGGEEEGFKSVIH